MLKSPAGFVIMTYIFVMNPVTHSATLLGENFRKETFCKTTHDFIFYFDKWYVTTCPIPP